MLAAEVAGACFNGADHSQAGQAGVLAWPSGFLWWSFNGADHSQAGQATGTAAVLPPGTGFNGADHSQAGQGVDLGEMPLIAETASMGPTILRPDKSGALPRRRHRANASMGPTILRPDKGSPAPHRTTSPSVSSCERLSRKSPLAYLFCCQRAV